MDLIQRAKDAPRIANYSRWVLRNEMDGYAEDRGRSEEIMSFSLWMTTLQLINAEKRRNHPVKWQGYRLSTVEGAQRYLDEIRRAKRGVWN